MLLVKMFCHRSFVGSEPILEHFSFVPRNTRARVSPPPLPRSYHIPPRFSGAQVLTLKQTGKVQKTLPVILFGKDYWEKIINWQVTNHGFALNMISSARAKVLSNPLTPSSLANSDWPGMSAYTKSFW